MMPSSNDVTIAFVPRETVSQTLECLERLIELTPGPYDLIAVVAGYPADLVAATRQCLDAVGGELIEFSDYITPNEARSAALAKTDTDYIAFVDHDVHVAENWLAPLVACARETDAAIVTPLIFEREPLFTYLHMVGGEAGVDPLPSGRNTYREIHAHAHEAMAGVADPIRRHATELAEFHAVLVETGWLRSVGGLDLEILSVCEHWDMCITAARTGRSIYVEPESKVTYVPVKQVTPEDARWFALRWSKAWTRRSLSRLSEKYDIDTDDRSFDGLRAFLRVHRSRIHQKAQRKINKVVGRRATRFLMKRVVAPAMEVAGRRQLNQDLAGWQRQHSEFIRTHGIGNQS